MLLFAASRQMLFKERKEYIVRGIIGLRQSINLIVPWFAGNENHRRCQP